MYIKKMYLMILFYSSYLLTTQFLARCTHQKFQKLPYFLTKIMFFSAGSYDISVFVNIKSGAQSWAMRRLTPHDCNGPDNIYLCKVSLNGILSLLRFL
jgi:hypothetical protein